MEYRYSLDDKGRLMIPSKLREQITANLLILTRGAERCLWLFPQEKWKHFSENLMASTSMYERKGRLVRRWIIAPAQEIEIDKSGRTSACIW